MASAAFQAQAQNQFRQALSKAEELRLEYRFTESARTSGEALEKADPAKTDSLTLARLNESRIWALNGEAMLGFAGSPKVVARKQVPLAEFHLWYQTSAGSWYQTPNVLSSSGAFPQATFIPEGAGEIYFSAPGGRGRMKLYRTEHAGELWSAPVAVSADLSSDGNEIFPMISPDGKTLWFTSDGFHGAGGYDLYVSHWNSAEKQWGEPENLGFPYSSPHNDYLFVNTPDGRYSILASDRECPGSGDVVIYVLEFDQQPLRHAVTAEQARTLAKLMVPAARQSSGSQAGTGAAAGSSRYAAQLLQVQAMQDRLAGMTGTMDRKRSSLAGLSGKARTDLEAELAQEERSLLAARDELASAVAALRQTESEMIAAGTPVDPQAVLGRTGVSADLQAGGASANSLTAGTFEFRRSSYGKAPQMQFDKAKSSFDYTFQVLQTGRFAEDNTLPEGLVYQIQIFSKSTGEAKESDLKGLSPVFSRRDKSGKTVYYAGIFPSYADCNAALAKAKRAGFKSAIAVAFRDGESISVTTARQLEKTLVQIYRIRIRPDGGRLSEGALSAINSATSKDLVRETQDGATTYLLGNFTDIDEASTVLSVLKAAGLPDVTLETVTQ